MIVILTVALPVALYKATGRFPWDKGPRKDVTLRVQWLPEIRSLEIKISAFKNNSPIPFISDVGDRESPWEVKVLASPTDKFRLRATQLQGGRLAVIIIDASGGFSQNQRLEPGTIEVTN